MSDSVTNTVRILLGGENFPECESPSLRLEKYVQFPEEIKKDGKKVEIHTKKEEVYAVVDCQRRHAKPIPSFEPKGAISFVAKLRSRLIVNQTGGILENAGLCLHPHFGAPYIPGSAVKGIARHAAWCEWKAAWCQWNEAMSNGDEAEAMTYKEEAQKTAKQIADVFGYPTGDKDGLDAFLATHGWKDKAFSGSVAFLSAHPIDKGELDIDLVNCHHSRYYSGNLREATDDESPNPQFFPTVKEGTSFVFSIAPVRPEADLQNAKDWLVKALSTLGAGAKTSAGYGWFDCDETFTVKWLKAKTDERTAAELKARRDAFSKNLETAKALPESELTRQMVDNLARQLDDIAEESFRNANIGTVNALQKRLPPENLLDKLRNDWNEHRETPIAVIGGYVALFESLSSERKELVCRLLWEQSGVGADFRTMLKDEARWPKLKPRQRDAWRKGLQALRTYAKTTLQMGKMP